MEYCYIDEGLCWKAGHPEIMLDYHKVNCVGCIRPKKKIVVLPSSEISEYIWVSWSDDNFSLIIFLKAPKSTTFGCIFHLLQKSGKKNTWFDKKLGTFPTLLFFKFYFWRWVGPWGQHSIFFSWPILWIRAMKGQREFKIRHIGPK